MNLKQRLLAFMAFAFLGTILILGFFTTLKAGTPFVAHLSGSSYAFLESKKNLISIQLPFLPEINLPNLSLSSFSSIASAIIDDTGNGYLQNACLNGQDPSTMGTQEQLLEFIQGPCLPVILVPGLLATKLQVNIDCETLQSENPEIFASCGWGTCSSWNIIEDKPDSYYTLWVSDLVGPMSVAFQSTTECWGNLIQLNFNASEPDITKRYTSPTGVQVVVKSQTDENQEECGLSAEDNLLLSPVQVGFTEGYEPMKNALIGMGYQIGLTLYGAPYDWRLTTLANGIGSILNDTVQQIYSLTGKPTVIVAHSLGNFGTLYLLNSLSYEQKQQYIFNYVSLMNPLNGAPKAMQNYVGGDSWYVYESYGVGYGPQAQLVSASSGFMDTAPKDPFTLFADSVWMQEWSQRVQYESEYDVTTPEGQQAWTSLVNSGNYPYSWFPTPLQQCFQGFTNRSDQCGLFMYDWSAEPMATINGNVYNGSESGVAGIFAEYVTTTEIAPELTADCKTNGIYLLQNPEVPTTIVYGSHVLTEKAFEWDYDPRVYTSTNNFAPANVTYYTQGDQTVPTTSSLLAALKWSWEFDNSVGNAQPVKTVEMCSIYNQRGTIYDTTDPNSPFQVLDNEYIGVGCDCIPQSGQTTSGSDCYHSEMITDSVLIKFVQNIVNGNVYNPNYTQTGAYLLNDSQLQQLAASCPSVAIGSTLYADLISQSSSQAISS